MKVKTPLFMTALLLACCGLVALSYWSPGAQAQARDTFCDDHEEGFEDEDEFGEEDEEDWEDEEEEDWEEEWGMEEAMFEVEILNQHLEMVNKLIEIVNGTSEVTANPTNTALMALITAKDMAGEQDEYAYFLEQQLTKVKDVAVRRAIHMQLAEAYAELDQIDKTKEHLSILIQGRD